jgi:tRNA (adenine37-N6)-methyltransferase
MASHITFTAVGIVQSPIREPLDDVWGGVTSRIELDSSRFAPDCLKGLDEFSHVEIVFTFHRIPDSEVYFGARRPRGRADWPEVSIFVSAGRTGRIGLE